jgi:hypothetical protein
MRCRAGHALALIAALQGLGPLAAPAQTGGAPEIRLPAGPAEAPAAPAPAEAAPEVPVIVLDPGTAAATPPGTAAPDEAPAAAPPPPLAVPVVRDAGGGATGPAAPLMIPLLPAGPALPEGVMVGGSLPQPGILRLTGETATQEMQLLLPEGAAPPQQELVLTLRSSVNVLPDLARISVSVNDAPPVEVALDRLGPFEAVRLPAPGLVPGANRVVLSLYQPHRIFCGPDATFQVWTEIDLAASGVALPAGALTTDAPGFAAAMRAQAGAGRPLGLQVGDGVDPAAVRSLARSLAAALGGAGRVEARRPYAPHGADLARVSLIASGHDAVSFRRDMAGAIVMVIELTGATPPDLATLLPPAPGAAQAIAGIPLLQPGAPVSFAQLGVPRIIGNTHYYRDDLAFRLPEDWLLLANQRAHLTLHYGFAEGLARNALLLVKINGETVRLLPMDHDGGKVLKPLDIPFAANLLHAGRNDLTLEAMVPGDPPDAPCARRRADMLVVLDDSHFDIPASPRMRLPGLAEPLSRLGGGGVNVPAEAPQKAQLDFALLPLTSQLVPLNDGAGPVTLNVVSLEGAGLVPLAGTGLSLRTVQRAVFRPVAAPEDAATPAAPAAPAFRLTESDAPAADAPAPRPGWADRMWSRAARQFTADGWLARQWKAIRDAAFLDSDGPLQGWLEAHSGTALLLRPDADEPDNLWLVLGPEADTAGLAAALDQFRRSGLARGDAALLQKDGSWIIWSSGAAPELLEPLTPGNIRAVLGNYASWSPLFFLLALLGLAILSVLPALAFILLTRRKGAGT